MATVNALRFVIGIYGLIFLITLFVVAVITLIRWISSDHPRITALDRESYPKREEVVA